MQVLNTKKPIDSMLKKEDKEFKKKKRNYLYSTDAIKMAKERSYHA